MAPCPIGEHLIMLCLEVSLIIDLSTIPIPQHLSTPHLSSWTSQEGMWGGGWGGLAQVAGREPASEVTKYRNSVWTKDLSCENSTIFQRTRKIHWILAGSIQGLGPQPALLSYSRSRENHTVLKPQEHASPSPSPLAMSIYREKPWCPRRLFIPEEMEVGFTDKIPFFTTIPWGWRLIRTVRRVLGSSRLMFS